mgnify:CR=1 FL=1
MKVRFSPITTSGTLTLGGTLNVGNGGTGLSSTPTNGQIDIGDRTIPNYDKFDLGTVPMAKAFANSCNTTFAELASRMPPTALTVAASQYGIGPDYTVEGLTTVTGMVSPSSVNTRVMPTLRPTSPKLMLLPFVAKVPATIGWRITSVRNAPVFLWQAECE